MVEDRERPISVTLPRRAIDWAAVGGLVLEWAIAIGEYVFMVLAVGFVGGYFGQLVDGGLYFVHEEWIGRGRTWGWVLGAVIAAIGLPLGWVRRDDKKFSFPSPRALRKKVSTRIGTRRKKTPQAHEFRTVGDIAKGGGLLGIIGAVLGFVLGGILVMGWFSLAMSPFASAEWFESLDFSSRRPDIHERMRRADDDAGGVAIHTDNPIAIYLWFTPVLALGAVGAVVGTAYGAAEYVKYVTSVPAAERERERREKQLPVVDEQVAAAAAIEQRLPVLASPPRRVPLRARWQLLRGGAGLGLVIGVIFFAAGVAFVPLLLLGWRHDPTQMPLVAVTFALIFLVVGLAAMAVCLRDWRRNVAILRRGYLARCRILECKDAQLDRWRPYDTAVDELRRIWDKPIAAVAKQVTTKSEFRFLGLAWGKTVTNDDMKSFRPFGTFLFWFTLVVVMVMGAGGVIMTVSVIHVAAVQREPLAWIGMLFVAAWWIFIVWMARTILRQVQVLRDVEKRRMKDFGIEPVVECRARFTLPDGKAVDFETNVDLSRELAGGSVNDDVAVYDPLEPKRALLLRHFRPALGVGEAGEWRFSRA